MSSASVLVVVATLLAAGTLLAACGESAPEEPETEPFTREVPAPKAAPVAQKFVLTVEGMTCEHCEASIQREVKFCAGVKSIAASHKKHNVVVQGAGMDEDEVCATIEKLGFTVKATVALIDKPSTPKKPPTPDPPGTPAAPAGSGKPALEERS